MSTIKNIINLLDKWAPPAYSEDFDNVGLLVGDSANKCKGVLVCLDCIESVVDEVISEHAELIEARGQASIGPLMGVVMARLGGAADGKAVSQILRQKIG